MLRTALARRHRPRRFGELVGQDHVARTLRAAVESGRLANAYLLCGPRGIGKTTAARVLAMALNCPERSEGEPCGTCDSCDRIWAGKTSLDVVEIDAASNRGVDDARDLRERAMYAPSDEHRYKVYIIDEAHMLTRDAWNALLKIIEEPPPRVVFAFATTEPHKIRQSAAPVLSRCQRFDFRRVSVPDLVARMREVLRAEGVETEEGALLQIARRADGGVRDALSLLDQVLSFSGDRIDLEDVREMLGLVAEETYLEVFEIVRDGDRGAVFPFVERLVDAGTDLSEFVRGLGEAIRILAGLALGGEQGEELTQASRDRFRQVAESFQEGDLLRMLAVLADYEATGRFRRSSQPRIQLEVLLLRLASLDSSVKLAELLDAMGGNGEGAGPPSRRDAPAIPDREVPGARGSPSPVVAESREKEEEPASEEGRLRAAWRAALDAAEGLGGQAVVLNGVRVESRVGSEIRLQVPSGLTADLQRWLDDPRRSAGLRAELARRLELEEGDLTFRVGDGGRSGRLTAEGARDQKLASLVERDPRLGEAVRELDLGLAET
ncbi:MAG: DNA polymerase III subunit gamma/tau [Gemmatimonadota bacterium]